MMTYTEEQLDEIDRLVAVHVMGWTAKPWGQGQWEMWYDPDGNRMDWVADWHPTTDRGQAMMVFEECEGMELSHTRDGYLASNDAECVVTPEDRWYLVSAKTPMLAICLGALKAIGVEVPK